MWERSSSRLPRRSWTCPSSRRISSRRRSSSFCCSRTPSWASARFSSAACSSTSAWPTAVSTLRRLFSRVSRSSCQTVSCVSVSSICWRTRRTSWCCDSMRSSSTSRRPRRPAPVVRRVSRSARAASTSSWLWSKLSPASRCAVSASRRRFRSSSFFADRTSRSAAISVSSSVTVWRSFLTRSWRPEAS